MHKARGQGKLGVAYIRSAEDKHTLSSSLDSGRYTAPRPSLERKSVFFRGVSSG